MIVTNMKYLHVFLMICDYIHARSEAANTPNPAKVSGCLMSGVINNFARNLYCCECFMLYVVTLPLTSRDGLVWSQLLARLSGLKCYMM